jgi:hypothetical protein
MSINTSLKRGANEICTNLPFIPSDHLLNERSVAPLRGLNAGFQYLC